MVLREDQTKVKALLTEAITVLCKNGLSYRAEFSVEGLLGITLDNEDVFLININETIRSEFAQALPTTPKAIPPMPHRTTPMSAPPKPLGSGGRGRGIPAGRGRPTVNQKPRKRSLDPDFKSSGSAPGTPTHPSPSPHSSMGSPPGTPGTPHQHPGQDTDQPPNKKLHEGEGDDVMIVSDGDSNPKFEHQQIKMEPSGMQSEQGTGDIGQWDSTLSSTQTADHSNDPNNQAMQVPSFGDELNLGSLDPALNVKMENAQHHSGTPTSSAPGMRGVHNIGSLFNMGKLMHQLGVSSGGSNTSKAGVPCSVCHKVLSNRTSLYTHMQLHTGKFSYYCEPCKKGYNNSGNYKAHMAKHLGKTFPCQFCNKRFKTEVSLKYHQSEHTGQYLYTCTACQKGFNNKTLFDQHRIKHAIA